MLSQSTISASTCYYNFTILLNMTQHNKSTKELFLSMKPKLNMKGSIKMSH